MNKQIAIAALSLMMSAVTFAHGNHDASAEGQAPQTVASDAPVSRAQVLANLEIYRKSGLSALDSLESVDVYSAAYKQAQMRYRELRASPAFAMAVARIAQQRGEDVAAAGGAAVASAR